MNFRRRICIGNGFVCSVSSSCLLGVLGCSDDTSDKMTDADDVDEATSFQLAPSFTLLNTELEEVSLSDYQGKVVIVDFWATWCQPCQEEIPRFIELSDEFREQGFEMIGISTDDIEGRLKNIETFFEELSKGGFDINYPILLARFRGYPEIPSPRNTRCISYQS